MTTDLPEEESEACKIHTKKKTLLEKYEIPIDHLSYEYIRACNNEKELERIVKILRSGEEGHFPDLQKTAEERLGRVSPDNRLLRTEVPALDRSCFNKQEWGDIMSDIGNWRKEVTERDKQLCVEEDSDVPQIRLPPVRQTVAKLASETSGKPNPKPKANKSSDYAFWDKYDVDTELLKIDLEEERKKNDEKEKNKLTKKKETDRLNLVVEEAQKCTETEKIILAEQEKLRGNEFYQAEDYEEAEKYYTASLAIHPTAKAFNNRASCYLKQDKYAEAIRDADNTLKLEPNNIKALYRKGIALKNMNENDEALESMNAILREDPNHPQAQNIAKQLTDKINAQSKTASRDMKQADQKRSKILSQYENRMYAESRNFFEVNDWGLPKVLCRCFGALKCNVMEDKITPQHSCLPLQNRDVEKKSENVRIIELPDEEGQPKQKNPTKLEIIEIDPLHQEPLKDFCIPKKCNIVDKRSHKASSEHGGGDVI